MQRVAWEHPKAAPLGPCGHTGEVLPLQVPPLDLAPGALGILAVGGLCLLACFLFTDFSLLTVLATESLLMGGWVLAVEEKSSGELASIQIWQDLPTLFSWARRPPQNQPAGPRKLCLGPLVSIASLLRGLPGLTQKTP